MTAPVKKTRAATQRAKVLATLPPADECEQAAISEATARNGGRGRPARMKVTDTGDGKFTIDPVHSDSSGWIERIYDTFATNSAAFTGEHVAHLINITKGVHPPRSDSADAGLAFVAALNPQDEVEAALGVQMYGAHVNAVEMMVRANKAGTVDHALAYSNIANKFARTFTAQMEALSKLRRGGEQIVRHIHVNVDNRGGQAVIAETVNTGGREERNHDGQPHEPNDAAAVGQSVLGHDPLGFGVPVPGDAERAVPTARRAVARGTEGQPQRLEARGAQRRSKGRAEGAAPADRGDEPQCRDDRMREDER